MARYDLDQRIDRGVHQLAEKILGKNDTLVKATNGREKLGSGIGDGPYDDFHKMLRTKWHQQGEKIWKMSLAIGPSYIFGSFPGSSLVYAL